LIGQGQLFVSSTYPKRWFAVDTLDQLVSLNNWHSEPSAGELFVGVTK
jgi:hypothetical protein